MSLPPFLPDTGPIRLPAHCGTAVAPALHDALLRALDAGEAPSIDASEVESLGQAVLQLLLAARAAAPALIIEPASAAFAERLRRLALAPALGLAAEG